MQVLGKIEDGRITFLALESELQEHERQAQDWRVLGRADAQAYASVYAGTWLGGPLMDETGCANYKLADGAPCLRTKEEKAAELAARPAPAPTQLDRVEAQAAYTAMMTGTLLEG